MGYDVIVWDTAPNGEAVCRGLVEAAWPALVDSGLKEGALLDRLSFANTLQEACAEANFVQESAPERIELKKKSWGCTR
jgi:carnitine 3-dehydrogenase